MVSFIRKKVQPSGSANSLPPEPKPFERVVVRRLLNAGMTLLREEETGSPSAGKASISPPLPNGSNSFSCLNQWLQSHVQTLTPFRAVGASAFIDLRQIIGPVLGQHLNRKRRLQPVFFSLHCEFIAPPVNDNWLVDGEAFWPRDLYEHAAAENCDGLTWLCQQTLQMMRRLPDDTKSE